MTLSVCLLLSIGCLAADSTNKTTNVVSSTLVSEIISLKTNGVSDAVIIAYIQNQKEKSKYTETINIESYEFFVNHYLRPRALEYAYRKLSPYRKVDRLVSRR